MSFDLLNFTLQVKAYGPLYAGKPNIRFSQWSVCVDLPITAGVSYPKSREVDLLTQSGLLSRTTSLGLEA